MKLFQISALVICLSAVVMHADDIEKPAIIPQQKSSEGESIARGALESESIARAALCGYLVYSGVVLIGDVTTRAFQMVVKYPQVTFGQTLRKMGPRYALGMTCLTLSSVIWSSKDK